MAKVEYKGLEFETEAPLKAFYWLTAVQFYDYPSDKAKDIASFAYGAYLDFDKLHPIRLIDFVCENYPDMSFSEMLDDLEVV